MVRKKHLVPFIIALALAVPSAVTLCLGNGAHNGRPPSEVFSGITQKEFTATYEQLDELAAHAASRKNNAFEFLRDIALHLAKQKASVRILGQDLRRVSNHFVLGNDVVNAILPLQNVVEMHIGYAGGGTEIAKMRVELDGHDVKSQFRFLLFTVVLHFEKTYGINLVSEERLGAIYGVDAERLGSTAEVLGVNLIRNTKIGVELNPGPSPTVTIAPIQRKRASSR